MPAKRHVPALIHRVRETRPRLKGQVQPYLIDQTTGHTVEAGEGLHLYRCAIPNGSIDLGVEVIAANIHEAKALCEAEARRLWGYRGLSFVRG